MKLKSAIRVLIYLTAFLIAAAEFLDSLQSVLELVVVLSELD